MSGDVVFDQPFLEHRDAQSYVAIAAKVTMEGFDVVEGLDRRSLRVVGRKRGDAIRLAVRAHRDE